MGHWVSFGSVFGVVVLVIYLARCDPKGPNSGKVGIERLGTRWAALADTAGLGQAPRCSRAALRRPALAAARASRAVLGLPCIGRPWLRPGLPALDTLALGAHAPHPLDPHPLDPVMYIDQKSERGTGGQGPRGCKRAHTCKTRNGDARKNTREAVVRRVCVRTCRSSFQGLGVLEAGQDQALVGLHDLAGEEHLVEDAVDLVKVEDQVQFAHVLEVRVQDLDEQVDRLQVGQLVVVRVDAHAKVQARVPPVDDLVVAELERGETRTRTGAKGGQARPQENSRGSFALRTSTKLDWFFWSRDATRRWTSPLSFSFSSSSKGMYHLASRVLPWRFCTSRKRICRGPNKHTDFSHRKIIRL